MSKEIELTKYLSQIAKHIKDHASDRIIMVFLPFVEISKAMCVELNEVGIPAVHVDSYMKDYTHHIQDFKDGKYQAACCSMLLTEGFDHPPVDCVVNLRNTDSIALYTQILGRGTRIHPGKENLLVLDFLYQTENFNICRPSLLFAKNKEVARRMDLELTDDLIDLLGLNEIITEQIDREKEESLLRELKKNRNKKAKNIDPIAFSIYVSDTDLMNYEPIMPWESEEPDEAILKDLFKKGIDTTMIRSQGYAKAVQRQINIRISLGLATPKQVGLLRKYKYKGVGAMTIDEAKKLISMTKANGWRPLKKYQQVRFIGEVDNG